MQIHRTDIPTLRGRFTWLPVFTLAAFCACPAWGATYSVTNTGDSSAAGSLRAAINSANADLNASDTISFNVTGTIALSGPLPAITRNNLTIGGPGASLLAIDGGGSGPIFTIGVFTLGHNDSGVTGAMISGLTIKNGSFSFGGGILNTGALTVNNCTLSSNSTYGNGEGGGIFNNTGATLTVNNSTLSGNSGSSGSSGGGIYNYTGATLTVNNSTLSGNSVVHTGGGILNTGTLTVTDSTLSGNTAQSGSGIATSVAGISSVINSTLSGNSGSSLGGGAILVLNGGAITVVNSTLSGNTGGAIFLSVGTVTLKNTLLAHGASGGNCLSLPLGTPTSLGHNLSDDTSCTGLNQTTDQNNVTSAGLYLGALANNGGPTQTIALLPGSTAVDAIPVSPTNYCTLADGVTLVATDQRGITRPQGPACDIGAFELVETVPFASFTAKLLVFPTAKGAFDLDAKFTPGAASKGIAPLTEAVTLAVGPYSVTIPAGSFRQLPFGPKAYYYDATANGAFVAIQIVPLGGNNYELQALGVPVNLAGVSNPVKVTIAIGNDTGAASVTATIL